MKIVSKIVGKILSYCSTCRGCPIGKLMDTPAEKEKSPQSQTHSPPPA